MYLENEEIDYLYEQINKIMSSINEDKPINMLNETDLLIKSLTEEEKDEETKKLEEVINKILTNPELIREIKLNQRIKTEIETGIEYYSEDLGDDKRIRYNRKLEKNLTLLQEAIRELISKIIKKTKQEMEM